MSTEAPVLCKGDSVASLSQLVVYSFRALLLCAECAVYRPAEACKTRLGGERQKETSMLMGHKHTSIETFLLELKYKA